MIGFYLWWMYFYVRYHGDVLANLLGTDLNDVLCYDDTAPSVASLCLVRGVSSHSHWSRCNQTGTYVSFRASWAAIRI